PGCSATNDINRASCASNATPVFADTTHGTRASRPGGTAATDPADPAGTGTAGTAETGVTGVTGVTGGACSTMRCALVPEIPNEDTPARRGRPSCSGQGRDSVSSATAPESQSTCEDGASTCNVLGSTPCRIASTILITLATPAAAWVCPMLDLTEP